MADSAPSSPGRRTSMLGLVHGVGWVRWALRIVSVVVTGLVLVASGRFWWPQPLPGEQPAGTYRQLAFVRGAIMAGADDAAQQQFPEGYVFLNALYGVAWVQAGLADPGRRGEALAQARWALARLESPPGRAPFDARLDPAYGVFWAGWSNWLRGGILALTDEDDPGEVRRFTETSAAIARAFTASSTPFLPAYPGQAWPVDSVVAIASLRLHDHQLSPQFAPVVARWLAAARVRLDPATGLLPHEASPVDGSVRAGSRATSQALIHRFLPEIDSGFARQQYAGYRRQFLSYPGGFGPALREYPHGQDGAGDVDSGPLIAGVSLPATVVAQGAARVNGDPGLAAALGSEGELLGLPLTLPGSKRYGFGLAPIGDAFLVWSATARLFTAPAPAGEYRLPWWWRLPWAAMLALMVGVVWSGPIWRFLRCRRRGRLTRSHVQRPGTR